jgi:RES domain-containing protein
MLSAAELSAALGALPGVAVDRSFARRVPLGTLMGLPTGPAGAPGEAVAAKVPTFLFISGSPYRFNLLGVPALYLGEGESTAGAEVKQHPGAAGYDRAARAPDVVYHVNVTVSALLDVTDPGVQAALGTNATELLSNWRMLSPAPTQQLGEAVYRHGGFEGIRYQSAAQARAGVEAYCVVLFRDRMRPGSSVRVFDPSNRFIEAW